MQEENGHGSSQGSNVPGEGAVGRKCPEECWASWEGLPGQETGEGRGRGGGGAGAGRGPAQRGHSYPVRALGARLASLPSLGRVLGQTDNNKLKNGPGNAT